MSCPRQARAVLGGGKQDVGSQSAKRFRKVGWNSVADERIADSLVHDDLRNESHGRQTQVRLEILGCLDPIVQIFEEECDADPAERTAKQAKQQIERPFRTHRVLRYIRFVHDADVAGFELAGHTGLLSTLQQALIDLLGAFDIPLQHTVVDRLAVHRERFALLCLEGCSQALFLRQCRLILRPHSMDDFCDLAIELDL